MKFKVGDVIIRVKTGGVYTVVGVWYQDYYITGERVTKHRIESYIVDRDCRKLTKLDKALK